MNRRAWLRRSGAGLVGMLGAGRLREGFTLPAMASAEPVVLPHPQSISFGSGRVSLSAGVSIETAPQAGAEARRAASSIARELGHRTGRSEAAVLSERGNYPIRLQLLTSSTRGGEADGFYRLSVTRAGTIIESRGEGFRYAAATFGQLLEQGSGLSLREVEIRDWPQFPWRAIFVEVTSGACMSRADWQELIDFAAALKLNALCVGLYNCWKRPSTEVLDEEYFLFPSRRYPQFKTPVRTYVRAGDAWKVQRALPAMAREDFLGELVAYGRARGVTVFPYFSSLGHNTLIPRLIPEVSMKDAQCRPIGYGFCTTCPKTYEVLFNLYDEIIERYARPYGVTTFHAGMDEVGHGCQCPSCRVAWNGERNFYVDHLVKIARHLKEQGMTRVVIWHDMLHRAGLLNRQLEARLESEGLKGILTIGWWYYGAPREGYFNPRGSFGRAFFRPSVGIDAWATPSAGWDTTGLLAGSDWTANQALVRLVRQGKSRGATGVISYSNHDPMFEQGYVNLAQYAWNPAPALAATQDRYARRLFGAQAERGAQAMQAYQDAYGVYGQLAGAFYRRPVPPRLGQAVAALHGRGLEKSRLAENLKALRAAASALGEIAASQQNAAHAETVRAYRAEVRRLESLMRLTQSILMCTSAYDDFRSRRDAAALAAFGERIKELEAGRDEHAAVLHELETVRFTPSLPRFIAYERQSLEDASKFLELFSEMHGRGKRGETDFMAEIAIAGEAFFATRLGMKLP